MQSENRDESRRWLIVVMHVASIPGPDGCGNKDGTLSNFHKCGSHSLGEFFRLILCTDTHRLL